MSRIESLSIDGRCFRGLRHHFTTSTPFQRDLARALGVSQSRISLWESGKAQCRINKSFLDGIGSEHYQLKEALLIQGLNSLKHKIQRGKMPISFRGCIPASIVAENADEIVEAIGQDLRAHWLGK
jgi:transcriptional regulator with XRE-family HTH domain